MKTDLELLNSSEEDLEWFQENFGQIQEEFPNMIVAIKDKKIVGSAVNVNELLSSLKEQGIDSSEVFTESIIPKGEIIVL